MKEDQLKTAFGFFNEIGIINQLATSLFNRQLPDGLHVSHFSVLNHLVRLGDGVTPLQLARAFQVTKGTMTHTLNGLSDKKLIKIQPHKTDGRSKLVYITGEGKAFQQKAIKSMGPLFDKLKDELDLTSLARLSPELSRIRAVLDQNRDI